MMTRASVCCGSSGGQKAQVEHLYAIAGRQVVPGSGEPEVIFCVDKF
jgi:hypothetical protein